MTRANINFIWQNTGEMPRTLFFYWNGDQYPRGIRDFYNVLDFVSKDMTAKRFKNWAEKNYEDVLVEDLGEGGQPKVYYTDGFITDYTYAFDVGGNGQPKIKVWEYAELIFDGDDKEFIKWIKEQE